LKIEAFLITLMTENKKNRSLYKIKTFHSEYQIN